MPSRLFELADWYRFSIERGYQFYSIENYWRSTSCGRNRPPPKTVVLRHDIDVDIAAARAMFSVEKELAIKSSYYFRLSTMDLSIMQDIASSGGEASYHYEELATEAKAQRLRSVDQVRARLDVIREQFRDNLKRVRAKTGLPMVTLADHGDWANRALDLANTEILEDQHFRKELNVQVEAYDYDLLKFVDARYTDAQCPKWWVGKRVVASKERRVDLVSGAPSTPTEAVRQGVPVIYVLLHPENWIRGPRWHFAEQLKRLKEGLAYRFRKWSDSPRSSPLRAKQLTPH
jgi:hypothetical protein